MSGLITYAIVLSLFLLFILFLHNEIKSHNKSVSDDFEAEMLQNIEGFKREYECIWVGGGDERD